MGLVHSKASAREGSNAVLLVFLFPVQDSVLQHLLNYGIQCQMDIVGSAYSQLVSKMNKTPVC